MTPKVPDYGHRYADKKLTALLRRLNVSYRTASISLREKIDKYLEQFEKQDAYYRALYDSGELSHEKFIKWRQTAITDTKAWRDMLEQLTIDMTHQNEIAASIIKDSLPEIYAENHNYGTFEAETGSGFDTTYTLYDKNTVNRLLRGNQELLPQPSVPIAKDMLWNRQHIQSSVLTGILTGESMQGIAKRFQDVVGMDERAAMRNARTAVTGAENAGRIDSYIRAEKMGIKMRQMWMATLDGRTRDSHAIMDGEQQEVGHKFSNGCRYPGDPQGTPGEIFNCRCRMKAVVEGSDAYINGYNPSLRPSAYLKEQGLTYEEWKRMHGERFYTKLFSEKEYQIPIIEKSIYGYEYGQPIKYVKIDEENEGVIRHSFVVTKESNYGFPDGTASGVFSQRDADIFTFADGTKLIFPSDIDKNKQTLTPEDLIEYWYELPEGYRNIIQKDIIICDYQNPLDKYWESKYNMTNFKSYMTGGKNITIWGKEEEHDMYYLLESLVHEGGHYIDNFTFDYIISTTKEWNEAVKLDKEQTGFDAPTGYARKVFLETGEYTEDFADSCGKFVLDYTSFVKRFPNRAKIIEELIKKGMNNGL